MLAGVFFPLVTEHLFSEALLLTGAVVALAWVTSNLVRWFRGVQESRRELDPLAQGNRLAVAGRSAGGAAVVADEPGIPTSPPDSSDDTSSESASDSEPESSSDSDDAGEGDLQ